MYVFKGDSFGGEGLDGHSHSRIVISCQEKSLSPKISKNHVTVVCTSVQPFLVVTCIMIFIPSNNSHYSA